MPVDPRLPLMTVLPVLVTEAGASAPKAAAVPRLMVWAESVTALEFGA